MNQPVLYLIPTPLGAADTPCLLAHEQAAIVGLTDFVVEAEKTARAHLKALGVSSPIRDLNLRTLNEHTDPNTIAALLAPLQAGRSMGLLSEAGCPAVADPGALLVRRAHEKSVRVVPLVGPSSLLLALMASGLNGQSFAFHGYLPVEEEARKKRLRELESESARHQRTQIFIETPYRNERMFEALRQHCAAETRVCIARDLTTADEWITTRRIAEWKKLAPPDLAKKPTVFLLLAA